MELRVAVLAPVALEIPRFCSICTTTSGLVFLALGQFGFCKMASEALATRRDLLITLSFLPSF
jgi:hypothetical protein